MIISIIWFNWKKNVLKYSNICPNNPKIDFALFSKRFINMPYEHPTVPLIPFWCVLISGRWRTAGWPAAPFPLTTSPQKVQWPNYEHDLGQIIMSAQATRRHVPIKARAGRHGVRRHHRRLSCVCLPLLFWLHSRPKRPFTAAAFFFRSHYFCFNCIYVYCFPTLQFSYPQAVWERCRAIKCEIV